MATFAQLTKEMNRLGIPLPAVGSGRYGKIQNRDLERALALYHYNKLPAPGWGWQARMALGEVALSYRFDALQPDRQAYLFEDNNDWIAEEKFDGVRMVITYAPEEGFRFFGRNRSRVTYLPIEYTDKILIDGQPGDVYKGALPGRHVFDAEILTNGYVTTGAGLFTGAGLNAATAVLQLNPELSHSAQRASAPLYAVLFDHVPLDDNTRLVHHSTAAYQYRRETLLALYEKLRPLSNFFKCAETYATAKRQALQTLLTAGKEGVILKNIHALYLPGARDRNACVKVKRTMTGSLGDDIDAYIIGCTTGEEWSKRGLIAGIKLAVNLRKPDGTLQEHWIATVSGIPDAIRERLTAPSTPGDEPALDPAYLGAVLSIDGQDISARNRRIAHAKVDWKKGFRADKTAAGCTLPEEFITGQIF